VGALAIDGLLVVGRKKSRPKMRATIRRDCYSSIKAEGKIWPVAVHHWFSRSLDRAEARGVDCRSRAREDGSRGGDWQSLNVVLLGRNYAAVGVEARPSASRIFFWRRIRSCSNCKSSLRRS
jgi:hypothetical protein